MTSNPPPVTPPAGRSSRRAGPPSTPPTSATPGSSQARTRNAPAIEVHDLHRSFTVSRSRRGAKAPVHAVRGIDLTIGRGEVVALLGPNGAGKTTTLDMILGFTAPTAGTVQVLGGSPADAVAAGGISSVMQTGGLLPRLTVGETLRLVASLFAVTDDLDAVARRAGVDTFIDRRVSACSGGQQQRLRFALALLPDPELIVLDEPTTGMDVAGRRDFWEAIRADADRGRTVVFATHYLAEADEMADRIVLMAGGRIVADGGAAQIKGRALGRAVRATLDKAHDAVLRELAGVTSLERRGPTVTIRTTDSDAVARHLFAATPASDVEITSAALEDAFVDLTRESAHLTVQEAS